MDVRVGGTAAGQKWRVTGLRATDSLDAPGLVQIEFYVEFTMKNGATGYERVMPSTLDPELARQLGYNLIDMADHADGLL